MLVSYTAALIRVRPDLSRYPRRVLAMVLLALAAEPAGAQVLDVRPVTPVAVAPTLRELRAQQEEFESFRRQRLPHWGGSLAPDRCDEIIGRFCYWYEEGEPDPPPEPRAIHDARERLIARLDSAGDAHPHDRWISGQRVRYLVEAERHGDAVAAARRCVALDWWCRALQGFAYHAAGEYAEADRSFESALALMDHGERCEWRDLKLLIDEELMRRYRDMTCAQRLAFEARIWWLSRPRMTAPGNDARTEYYSRAMMVRFLEDAPSTYRLDFGADERELLLRYGWPTAWTRAGGTSSASLSAGLSIVGHEPRPAYPFIPPASALDNPATSDSAIWRSKGVGRVLARYAPAYARRLLPLEHQAGLFRRGDSALVVAAWSVAGDTALAAAAGSGELTAALALTKGDPSDTAIARDASPGTRGILRAGAPWGSMLLSLEVAAPSRRTLARARYGVRGSDVPGSRVQMSDVLLYEPYEGLPRALEDVLPHVRVSERVTEGSSVGLYWETYNTNPTGEAIDVSITVVAMNRGGGWLTRALRSLRGVREQQPITMGMQDVSARVPYAPRSVVVDLSTLRPGRYRIEVEQDAGAGNVVRAQRSITVVERQ